MMMISRIGRAVSAQALWGWLAVVGYIASIYGANWMLLNFGLWLGEGPRVIPVGFGLYAPSGVLMVGLALFLRDLVQDRLGREAVLLAIAIGAALSFQLGATLALASAIAFVASELADMLVYTPLRERGRGVAVLLSGVAGSVVDSAVFLFLAFGSFDFLTGQVVGKLWITILAAVFVGLREILAVKPELRYVDIIDA